MEWFKSIWSKETKSDCIGKCNAKYADVQDEVSGASVNPGVDTPTRTETGVTPSAETPSRDETVDNKIGGSRRRRRCTKKHRHTSACKLKAIKGKGTKGRKTNRKRR
jgi:hypothetical protein